MDTLMLCDRKINDKLLGIDTIHFTDFVSSSDVLFQIVEVELTNNSGGAASLPP